MQATAEIPSGNTSNRRVKDIDSFIVDHQAINVLRKMNAENNGFVASRWAFSYGAQEVAA